jgi:hypothetical protein
MIRFVFVFVILAVLIHFGITVWRKMDGKEQLALTKRIGYSIIVALLALMMMTALIVLF